MNDIIIYSVVKIEFTWQNKEPRPFIITTYKDFKDAVAKKDLCREIARLDKSDEQYYVVAIKLTEKDSNEA
ncbi:MAG: hypothetical protein O3A39_06805 [Proteobacteria bacterium]|nr:hypothetical protein [Pseudomonadota bacterium]